MPTLELASTTSHRFAESAAPSTPASGFGYIYLKTDGFFYTKNDAGDELRVGFVLPNNLDAWGSYPDADLMFAAQESGGTFYGVRGDEMRMHENWDVTGGNVAADSSSEMNIIFDDTTDRTFTLSNVLGGHSLIAKAKQISGGTGHKILLPMGCTWNNDGANRALLLNAATDWVIAAAWTATNYEVMAGVGISYAAS